MKLGRGVSPYLKSGRLADVIAALQVMGAGQRPEMEMVDWAKELSRSDVPAEIDRWTRVFSEHPEFFLTYVLHAQGNLKAALRWRYTNKLYDAKTGKEYTPEEKEKLPQKQQWDRRLTSDAVAALMNTAIELHSRAIEELSARRWWVPILAAFLGFFGALIGAFFGSHK